MSNLLNIQRIIDHLQWTKDESWCEDVVRTKDGRNCIMGHIFDYGGNLMWDAFENCIATTYMIYPVNDGKHPNYQQPTAKERCIAYLTDLRDGKERTTQQIMDDYESKTLTEKPTNTRRGRGKAYTRKKIYPKSVYAHGNGFMVQFHSKKYQKTVSAGWKQTLEDAIEFRDKFIAENIDDLLEGYLPRGLTKSGKGYSAKINFEDNELYLGVYDSIESATKARHEYLDSLK